MDEILLEVAASGYVKRYCCPYCSVRLDREALIHHVEKEHSAEIPEGYTPTRVVFNTINKKDHGNCVICGRETKWDENKARYDRICQRQECMNEYRSRTKANMIRVYGTDNLLKDPQQQQRMLANRKISGEYKWSDNTRKGYTGIYEKNTLEFLDKVMEYKSEDVLTPGPVIEYEYNGEKHFWITDIYIPAYGLCIDVKDGGKNPNNRPMKEYREKQIAKEKAIISQKQYNYLRLTDNNFSQLMSILAELKLSLIDHSDRINKISRVHENMFAGISAMMPIDDWQEDNGTFIVNYLKNMVFIGEAWTNSPFMDRLLIQDNAGFIHETSKEFLEDAVYTIYKVDRDTIDLFEKVSDECGQEKPSGYILEQIFGYTPLTHDEWICREDVHVIPDVYEYLEACGDIAYASISPKDGMPYLTEDYNPDTIVRAKTQANGGVYLENSITGMRTLPKDRIEDFSDIEYALVRGGLF